MNPPVCPACGARLAPGATQCDLCGHVLGDERVAERDEVVSDPEPVERVPEATSDAPASDAPAPPPPVAPPAAAGEQGGSFCIHCGAKNPAYARFCYNCGQALLSAEKAPSGAPDGAVPVVATTPVVPAAPPPAASGPVAGERPDSDAGKRALTLVGVGVLVVLVLFFITRASQNSTPPPPAATAGAAPTAPQAASDQLSDDALARVASLESEIEAATSDEERIAKQEALAGLYTQEGAFSRAAVVQEEIAESVQTALAWADAGSLYLAHMLRAQGPDRATYAQLSATAYEKSLAIDSTDLDVKTDLATAYLNDQQNPMRAVATVKEVLTKDPDHVRANFNYGLMLAQINRIDQALEQFQKVVGLTDPSDPVHQRAEQELARLQAEQGGTASG